MSYAPGAPAAVWAIPSAVLGAGAKLTLMALWSKADHVDQRLYEPVTVWFAAVEGETPSASLLLGLADKTGTNPRAVRQHLTKLRGLGLVVTHGRLVVLTPTCQLCHASVAACRCSVDALTSLADAQAAEDDAFASQVDAGTSPQLTPPIPPTPPSPGDVASARPEEHTPHGNDNPDTRRDQDQDDFGATRRGAPRPEPAGARVPDAGPSRSAAVRGETRHHPGPGLPTDAATGRALAPARPAHVEAVQARARGGAAATTRAPDPRATPSRARAVAPPARAASQGARIDHALPPELLAVVNPTSWSYEAEHPRWRETMHEAVRDLGLVPADVAKVFRRYESSAPSVRPARSQLWWSRHRKWIDRALDRDAKPQSSAKWDMDGDLHVVGGAS